TFACPTAVYELLIREFSHLCEAGTSIARTRSLIRIVIPTITGARCRDSQFVESITLSKLNEAMTCALPRGGFSRPGRSAGRSTADLGVRPGSAPPDRRGLKRATVPGRNSRGGRTSAARLRCRAPRLSG